MHHIEFPWKLELDSLSDSQMCALNSEKPWLIVMENFILLVCRIKQQLKKNEWKF